jgi:Holliday junction DNA helicase RuvA
MIRLYIVLPAGMRFSLGVRSTSDLETGLFMIGFIRGVIDEIEPDALLIDRGGIGFRVYVPSGALDGGVRVGDEVKLYTHLNVKEDSLTLFGFFSRDDLEVFRLLVGVSGIGPKGAMGILSTLSADDLRFAVLSDDASFIAKAPGIGKKTAQKVILELKDKFQLEDAYEKKLAHTQQMQKDAGAGRSGRAAEKEAVEALCALGYSGTEALQAVRRVDGRDHMDTEEILKAALQEMI